MNIYEKIANIQDEVQNITKDAKNPHFGNSYATYEQVMNVLHPILRKHKLMVYHSFEIPIHENQIPVTTVVRDLQFDEKTGTADLEKVSTTLYIPMVKVDPQAAGSAITYAKRYSLLAMLGLGTEDDDAESASGNKPQAKPKVEKFVEGHTCPKDEGKLIEIVSKKNGKTYWKCSNGKFENGVASGCDFFQEKPVDLVTNENGSKSWGKTEFSEPH